LTHFSRSLDLLAKTRSPSPAEELLAELLTERAPRERRPQASPATILV